MRHCYFLCFRRRRNSKIHWRHPTGGLVVEPDRVVSGIPLAALQLVADVFAERYHCGPGEELIIAEVFEKRERRLALTLHRRWEREAWEFRELMMQ